VRVLWWNNAFWPSIGGVEILGGELLYGLKDRGLELAVVAHQDADGTLPASETHRGIPIARFPFHAVLERGDPRQVGRLRREVRAAARTFAPDLVHLHTLTPTAWFCGAALGDGSARLLVTRHAFLEGESPPARNSLAIHLLRRADWIACCSRAVLEETHGVLPEIAARSSVILNGLPPPTVEPGPPPDPPVLLCLGRHVRQKGFDLALTALAKIRSRFPRIRLVMAGDGPERSRLEAQAHATGIRESVDFTGWVPPGTVPELIVASTLVLVPSRAGEGFCLAALQAGQAGRPVVAARVGGIPELVRDGETGILVEPGDPGALGRAVMELLERPETVSRMAVDARLWTKARFGGDRYVEEYAQLYRQLVPAVRHQGARAST
jgi:glycosyltransferase involved in cell wall biosynthesis